MTKRISITLTCLALLLSGLSSTAINDKKAGKTIVLFSKASKGGINVHIKGNADQNIELYLFDSDGNLIHKTESKAQVTITLPGLKRGQYLYQCFDEDVQLKSGNLMVQKNSIDYD